MKADDFNTSVLMVIHVHFSFDVNGFSSLNFGHCVPSFLSFLSPLYTPSTYCLLISFVDDGGSNSSFELVSLIVKGFPTLQDVSLQCMMKLNPS